MSNEALRNYLQQMHRNRASGFAQAEQSYYTPLENLLTEVGKSLNPKVHCLIQLKDQGAGHPDGGLFTSDQIKRNHSRDQVLAQKPSRGVIECKPVEDVNSITAASKQVEKYWNKYRKVLVTNYRDFVLIIEDEKGAPSAFEQFSLADSEEAFWMLAQNYSKTPKDLSENFTNFLRRILTYGAAIVSPADLAASLAVYAQEALHRITESNLAKQERLKKLLENSLGINFEGSDGEHFFRSTMVQTLFYGMFSAWVIWCKDKDYSSVEKFNWKESAEYLHLPVIRKLFHELADPADLKELKLAQTLSWACDTLNRVHRAQFFKEFSSDIAVEYFYEPFLKEFDPILRKRLGVWFTPPEVVKYMVARVHDTLINELSIPGGLANDQVYVLDPCCGTGTFMVEILRTIYETIGGKNADILDLDNLKESALKRILGFEILPASFIISHLRLGLLFADEFRTPLSEEKKERIGVFLTNSLTGWSKSPTKPKEIAFSEFLNEKLRAEEVKRGKPILVIIGNPPYNAFEGVSPDEELGIIDVYKGAYYDNLHRETRFKLTESRKDGGWGIRRPGLHDLYVRFFSVAENKIVNDTGKGVICYISNNSYLSDPSFVLMRKSLLKNFNNIWIDNMNGDSRETGKRTPDGKPDPSVFSSRFNSAGIRVGVSIALFSRSNDNENHAVTQYRNFWGLTKKSDLYNSLTIKSETNKYSSVTIRPESKYSFKTTLVSNDYYSWPSLKQIARNPPSLGLLENRGESLIDLDSERLKTNISMYFDKHITMDSIAGVMPGVAKPAARYNPHETRIKALSSEGFKVKNIVPFLYRPFDIRWCYYSSLRPLWNECRPSLWQQVWAGNRFFVSRAHAVSQPEGVPAYSTTVVGNHDFQKGHSYYFPHVLRREPSELEKSSGVDSIEEANVSLRVRSYLEQLDKSLVRNELDISRLVWNHVLAISFTNDYIQLNKDGVESDWLRIPFPAKSGDLINSAKLGEFIHNLIDGDISDNDASSVSLSLDAFSFIGKLVRIDTELPVDLSLSNNWGYRDGRGAAMPGSGKVIVDHPTQAEIECIATIADKLSISVDSVLGLLGKEFVRVCLNENVYWSTIPLNVWNFHIGGYQVLKKWLSYRSEGILDRALLNQEAQHFQKVARRISVLLALQPQLARSYNNVVSDCFNFELPSTMV